MSGFHAALDYTREGDVLVVTKPDRLARSTADFLAIVARLEAKDVALRILSMGGNAGGLDTRDPTNRFMLTMLGAVAEFERNLMKERQREGIAQRQGGRQVQSAVPSAASSSRQAPSTTWALLRRP